MSEFFISLPTVHGDAKVLWDKAKFSAIIPTGPQACVLHYDGIPLEISLSAGELADKLQADPRVSLVNLRKKWIGQAHEGYNHLTMHYSLRDDYGDDRELYWLHQLLEVQVFILPFFNSRTQKLTTQLRLVGLAHAFEQDPFAGDFYHKSPNLYRIAKMATGGFEVEYTLPSQHNVTEQKIHEYVVRAFREASVVSQKPSRLLSSCKNQKRHWLAYGSESFLLSDSFPAKTSKVIGAEYQARLADFGAVMRDNFAYQIADLHAQARIKAAEMQAQATIAAGMAIASATLNGLGAVAWATSSAGATVRDGLITAAKIRENIRIPRL